MPTPDPTHPLEPAPSDPTRVDPVGLATTSQLAPLEPGAAEPPGRRGGAVALPGSRSRRGWRMRTVVLGLVLLAASGTSLARLLTGARVDDAVVALVVLLAAGALLLGGGIVATVRDAPDGDRGGA